MPAEFFIDHLQGDRAGQADHFTAEVVRIGRSNEFELCFDEMGVSWEHAEIRRRDGDWWVIDHGSTNGTYVNDERAHNARLRDGDVLKFGKKGSMLRFRLGPAAPSTDGQPAVVAGPPPSRPPRPRRPSEPDFAVPVLDERILDAHSDLPAAAVREPARGGWALAIALSLGVLLLAASGAAFLFHAEAVDREEARRRAAERADQLEKDLRGHEAQTLDRVAAALREGQVARDATAVVQGELDRARRAGEEEKLRLQQRVTELERQLRDSRRPQVQPPQQPPAGNNAGNNDNSQVSNQWKDVLKRVKPSIVFIATHIEGRTKDGTTVPLHSYGTGFFVSTTGHIVTNKHVIEPWKFRPLAERMATEQIEVVSWQVHVWRAGDHFLIQRPGGPRQLDLTTGYSTSNGTLDVVRTPPDRWSQMSLPGEKGIRAIRFHDEQTNEDLAILRAHVRTPSQALPIGSGDRAETLDDVLVLGFPAGPAILEAGIAETSPATGQIRKVENTITVNCSMIGGNSGGPLIDRRGRVIGITTRVAEGTETLGSCLKIEHAVALLQGGAW